MKYTSYKEALMYSVELETSQLLYNRSVQEIDARVLRYYTGMEVYQSVYNQLVKEIAARVRYYDDDHCPIRIIYPRTPEHTTVCNMYQYNHTCLDWDHVRGITSNSNSLSFFGMNFKGECYHHYLSDTNLDRRMNTAHMLKENDICDVNVCVKDFVKAVIEHVEEANIRVKLDAV